MSWNTVKDMLKDTGRADQIIICLAHDLCPPEDTDIKPLEWDKARFLHGKTHWVELYDPNVNLEDPNNKRSKFKVEVVKVLRYGWWSDNIFSAYEFRAAYDDVQKRLLLTWHQILFDRVNPPVREM